MPTYEITFLMRKMAQPLLVDALKRTAGHIYNNNGFIRKMESLGERELPNKKSSKGLNHTHATYFTMDIDLKISVMEKLFDEYRRDQDIIQHYYLSKDTGEPVVCPEMLEGERLPPSERPSVQRLIEQGRRKPRFAKIWDDNTGLDYYPFHR